MEQETFGGVRDMLHELGAIDASGLNYRCERGAEARIFYQTHSLGLQSAHAPWKTETQNRKLSGKRTAVDVCLFRPAAEEAEAVVLDMGEYEAPLALAPIKAPADPVPALPQLQALRHLSASMPPVAEHWPNGPFLPGAMASDRSTRGGGGGGGGYGGYGGGGAPPRPSSARRPGARVRLVQICAPPVLGRAKVFGNRLALKDDWVCVDSPYFDAPAALVAPLGDRASLLFSDAAAADAGHQPDGSMHPDSYNHYPGHHQQNQLALARAGSAGDGEALSPIARSTAASGSGSVSVQRGPLPNVTLVFASVDGAKNFIKRRRSFADEVHALLSLLFREALRFVPGGYFCREQEGDLKVRFILFCWFLTRLLACSLLELNRHCRCNG
jgi:hypothetical protein